MTPQDHPEPDLTGPDGNVNGPSGFIIRRLILTGTHVKPASLEFARGLNVITGSSDTGKSFAVECIDYMLGAKDRPREIPHARPYEVVALEIEAANGDVFTIQRTLEGGRVRWYRGAFDALGADSVFDEIAAQHSPTNTKTLSYRLLDLCGLAGRILRKNKKNVTRTISFRNLVKLVLIDEERVITRRSPVLGEVVDDATADKSLFALLLTGRDDAGLVAQADSAERKTRLIAQADLLDGLLHPEPSDAPASPPPDRTELTRQRAALRTHIDELTAHLTTEGQSADAASAEREAALEEVVQSKSRLLVVSELLSRFALLRDSYNTDLQRLGFIAEGHHYFAQLSAVNCPTCSRPLTEAAELHAFCQPGTPIAEDVQAACAHEAAKIQVHLTDLNAAVLDLERERGVLRDKIRGGTERYRQIEIRIEKELRPRLASAAAQLKQSMATHDRVLQKEAELDHRAGLLERKLDIERMLQEMAATPDTAVRKDLPYAGLSGTVTDLLHAWKYPGAGQVGFDERKMDITVDGEARETHGKGVRAIMFAAFTIGLMRYCRSQNLAHPGFVVLDSPLTTYRRRGADAPTGMSETGSEQEASSDGDAPEDMQRAFFEHLARTTRERGEQVIVFENKEPPDSVKEVAVYVQFTGVAGTGRAGLIPE